MTLFGVANSANSEEAVPVSSTFKVGSSTAEVRYEDPAKRTRVELHGTSATVVDEATGKELFQIEMPKQKDYGRALKIEWWSYNPSGSRIAIAGGDQSEGTSVGTYSVFSAQSGKKFDERAERLGAIKAIGFSASGSVIYRADQYELSGK